MAVSLTRNLLVATVASASLVLPGAPHLAPAVLTVIGTVSGHPVQVHCGVEHGGYIDVLGHSDRGLRLIELHPRICGRLDNLVAAPAPIGTAASAAESEALLVALHEAVHLSAYGAHADEAEVECRAVQLVAPAALHLGLNAVQAAALGHAALLFHQRLPGPGDWRVGLHEMPNYQSPDCYDGGPLDIDPESSNWPN
jgi:hypothetical protein